MTQEHKDYITKNNIDSLESLKTHLQYLSDYRSALTPEGEKMFRELSCLVYDDRESVLSFFAGNALKRSAAKNVLNETQKTTDSVRLPLGSNGTDCIIVTVKEDKEPDYVFSWRPSQKTESSLNNKPVHSNPWIDNSYCPRNERVKDVEKENLPQFNTLMENIKRQFDSPLTPKQKDKVTAEDLKVFKGQEEKDIERFCEFAEHISKTKGVKESQTVKKAPIFTYCKQMKNAIEQLAFRSLYGHERYEKGDDWENFSRVPNAEFEYSNSMFRHALDIGDDEDEFQHLVAQAWNSVARLEIYLRNQKLKNS